MQTLDIEHPGHPQQSGGGAVSSSGNLDSNETTIHPDVEDLEEQQEQPVRKEERKPRSTKCNLILSDAASADMDSTDDSFGEQPLCAICLNVYQEGDTICWSRNSECDHVFHHECIEEWLLQHDDCPCCRSVYLELKDDTNRNDKGDPTSIRV